MGISCDELSQRYPTLYHMASYGSWPVIREHGLLSTLELLGLLSVPEPRRSQLLETQRKESIPIAHATLGVVTIRDQKPLSAKNLARCLTDCDAPAWYKLLNERVFFWLDKRRLVTLMSAGEYSEKPHTVLQVDTHGLVHRYEKQIELAAMNTGNTRPFAHPRGRATFRNMEQYPYEERRRRPDYSAVVELTVIGGVPDIRDYVIRVEHAASVGGQYETSELLFEK
jgi:hypothetical protein